MLVRTLFAAALLLTPSCTYLKYARQQAEYALLQEADPSQRNVKHMIDRSTFAVIGMTTDPAARHEPDRHAMAVAAFSSRFKDNELVDVMHDIDVGTHFGLHLPPGDFDLLVLPYRRKRRSSLTRPDVGQNLLHRARCSVLVMPQG